MACQGLSYANIRYGKLIWEHDAASERALLLQNKRSIRLISAAQPRDHCHPFLTQLKLMRVYNQFILNSLIYVKTNLRSVQSRGQIHERELRSSRNLNRNWCGLKKTREDSLYKQLTCSTACLTELSLPGFWSIRPE